MSARSAFNLGLRDMAPMALGGAPFGLIAGIAAAQIGMSAEEATAASIVMFSGAAQLATFDLLKHGAPFAVVFITALIINLRFAIYSAAIAGEFHGERRLHRWLYSYLLTDQAFALTIARRTKDPAATHAVAYYLGAAVLLWIVWAVCTFVGAVAGSAIPPAWGLDFAVPLCFVAILMPLIVDRAQIVCALITAIAALVFLRAPNNTVVIISVVLGIAGAALFDRSTA